MNSTAVFVLATLSILLVLSAGEEYDFLYYIYYSDSECSTATAGVVGKVAGESFVGVGGRSPDGLCSEEAICLMDDKSERCQSLGRTANGTVELDVDDFGVIVECDNSNTDEPQCAPMPRDCLGSSVFPSCKFRLRSQQQLLERPEELLVTPDSANLDTHSYMLFFKDDECSEIAGIKGLVSGKSDLTGVDSSVSCNKAVTCILAPEGDACQAIIAAAKTETSIHSETTSDGRQVLSCLDDGSCQFVDDGCVKSDILESCYVKWMGPTSLFQNPQVVDKATADDNTASSLEEGKADSTTKPTSGTAISGLLFSLLTVAIAAYQA